MRALETEVSRLREAYTQEISSANVSVQQQRQVIHSVTEENDILKEILSAHGIAYEGELERRKADRPKPGYHQSSPFTSSLASTVPPVPASNSNPVYTTPPTTVSSSFSPRNGENSVSPKSEPVSRGSQMHSHCELDLGMSGPVQAVQAASGVFETDPQMQIDFVLTCVPFLFFPKSLRLMVQSGIPMSRTYRLPLSAIGRRSRRRGHAFLRPRVDGHLSTPDLHRKDNRREPLPAQNLRPPTRKPQHPPQSKSPTRHRGPNHPHHGPAMSQAPRAIPNTDTRRRQDHHGDAQQQGALLWVRGCHGGL